MRLAATARRASVWARTASRRHWRGLALGAAANVIAAALTLAVLDEIAPPPLDRLQEVSVTVNDRNGELLRAFSIADGRWRLPVTPGDVDPVYLAMLLAYEDKRFEDHAGVDPLALLRAVWQFASNGRIVSGASTITMQVARLLEPREARSLSAKVRQMLRALQIERRLGKPEILQAYLTLAPYGGNIEGVRAAALTYFGKEPGALTIGEAALLVALPQLPEARRPDRNPDAAKSARDRVLRRMADLGVISNLDADREMQRPVPNRRRPLPAFAAHEAERAVRSARAAPRHTLSIDRTYQSALETMVRERLHTLGSRTAVAILLADHKTGEVLARVGSADYFDARRSGAIDMTRAVRSPGSTLKPFIYGLALEAGLVHPETLIDDRPTNFHGYRPGNFDMSYQGTVSVREALQLSLNVPAVRLLEAVGPMRLMAAFRGAGVTPQLPNDEPAGLAIGLGGVGLTLEDLVTLYTGLPREGRTVALRGTAADRQEIFAAPRATAMFAAPASWHVGDMLSGTPPPDAALPIGIAYKTGTSYGYRDAWAIGFDGHLVMGVWVGRADAAPIAGLTGRTAAAPILFEGFSRLPGERTPLPPPPPDTLHATTADLPGLLQRFEAPFSTAAANGSANSAPLAIIHPPEGARVALAGSARTTLRPLILKADGGTAPYRWFANGAPLETPTRRPSTTWTPDTAGYSTFTVVDAEGRTDRVSIYIE